MNGSNVKYGFYGAIFLLLVLIASMGNGWIPFNAFAFRCWEATSFKLDMGAPFYPDVKLNFEGAQGDLGHHTKNAVLKNVVWNTDSYGYRSNPDIQDSCRAVLVGDSFITAPGTTQMDTPAMVLSSLTGIPFCSLAPASFSDIYRDPRFSVHPPKYVILQCVERNLYKIPEKQKHAYGYSLSGGLPEPAAANPMLHKLFRSAGSISVGLDRFLKQEPYYWLKRITGGNSYGLPVIAADDGSDYLFYSPTISLEPGRIFPMEPQIEMLKQMQNFTRRYGGEFLFLPVPDKVTVYFSHLPEHFKTIVEKNFQAGRWDMLYRFQKKLDDAGVNYVDILTPLLSALRQDKDVYFKDDTHWNSQGIRIAMEEISRRLFPDDDKNVLLEEEFISINSNPTGMAVSVNDKVVGKTPVADIKCETGDKLDITFEASSGKHVESHRCGKQRSVFYSIPTTWSSVSFNITTEAQLYFEGQYLGWINSERALIPGTKGRLRLVSESGECLRDINIKDNSDTVVSCLEFESKKLYQPLSFYGALGDRFLYFPPGEFFMGSTKYYQDESPVHKVRLTRGYYLSQTEVTQKQWNQLMEMNPSKHDCENCPVETVKLDQIDMFIERLNERETRNIRYGLPTEAQWEYAARTGVGDSDYCFGNDSGVLKDYAWFSLNANDTTHPVGTRLPCKSGLYDLHGNVLEFVSDRKMSYSVYTAIDPFGGKLGHLTLTRGGGYRNTPLTVRTAYRNEFSSRNNHYKYVGFRLAAIWLDDAKQGDENESR